MRCIYDKIRDLEQARISENRAIEEDNALRFNLFDKLQQRRKLEFLRMEVRLNKRQKTKQLFNSFAITSNLTFKSLFKSVWQKLFFYIILMK